MKHSVDHYHKGYFCAQYAVWLTLFIYKACLPNIFSLESDYMIIF